MKDIPNTEYITINKDGIFVGEKSTPMYHGQEINSIDCIRLFFGEMQREKPEVKELHVGAFKTKGACAETGNPTKEFGPNAWCRVKLSDGRVGPWVFWRTYNSAANCAVFGAYACCNSVRHGFGISSAVLEFAKANKADAKKSDLKQMLANVDLAEFVGKQVELNGYVITVQKQR